MPQDLYVLTTQSLADLKPGLPVRRGPIESKKTCASGCSCELSMPMAQMRLIVASDVGKVPGICAAALVAPRSARRVSGRKRTEEWGVWGGSGEWLESTLSTHHSPLSTPHYLVRTMARSTLRSRGAFALAGKAVALAATYAS